MICLCQPNQTNWGGEEVPGSITDGGNALLLIMQMFTWCAQICGWTENVISATTQWVLATRAGLSTHLAAKMFGTAWLFHCALYH
jgi:hypothetical protein